MKKKLLFVMNNLNCGGAEKSLISLLQAIDYSRCEVDLLLFKREGMFMDKVPEQVRVLAEPSGYTYFDMPVGKALAGTIRKGRIDIAWSRLRAGLVFRRESNRSRCEQRVWKYIGRSMTGLSKEYDAAIGYLEKSPVYYVIDKVKARTKIGFIHNDYDKLGMDPGIDLGYFKALDYIATVSEECVNILADRFPMYRDKIVLMHNIVSPAAVLSMAQDNAPTPGKGVTIVSVGRLNYQKGFELAVEACELLVKDGFDIRWYIVGEGEERGRLEQSIKERQLQDSVILTGLLENPYPYIKTCDIYVQTSFFEGRCLTVTEAKILHKPIVSTNFKVIYDQLTDGHNGLIVEQNAASVYQGVKKLINSETLRRHLTDNLRQETLGTEHEIHKLYQWIS
ncbi:glycosyltransferase [Paenibacillus sepulcri]|uniref:Glycosyltransferase n=1 Tax=Paenibacillus sepulcri TaxID=359917 RepID=A0ABS7C9Y6_9BACL|nr:glycosyltransferase [Paenibacillus sepulcri]